MATPSRRGAVWLHLCGVLAVPGCLAAGIFEWHRAQAGNELSWGYTVEWPLIAAYGTYVWVRLVRERRGTGPASARTSASNGTAASHDPASDTPAASTGGHLETAPDPGLDAWREYLTRLHAAQPPGGPPAPAPRRTR